jgi:hypothetical protein
MATSFRVVLMNEGHGFSRATQDVVLRLEFLHLRLEFLHLREGGKSQIRGMHEFSGSFRSDALYQGPTWVGPVQAATKICGFFFGFSHTLL